jgi:hypothetical protein
MAHSPEVRDAHGWLLRVASALDSFRAQRGHYPPGGDLAALEVALVPEHLRQGDWRPNDPWGRAWRYRSNDVGTSYSLVTAGSDGVFETLVPLISGPVAGDERDLVLTDGRFARWPAGLEASAAPLRADGARAPVTAVTPTRAPASLPVRKEPPDLEPGRAATTVSRLQVIAALLEAWRKEHGSYPEGDDAGRLVSEDLKSSASVQDGWGRDLAYVTRGAGSRYVLVSAGPNGRLDRFVGDYADLVGSPGPAGDDLLVRDGKLVK